MAFGKRQLVLAALVVALGAAVYLNWQFSGDTAVLTGTESVESEKNIGEAQLVNGSAVSDSASASSDTEAGTDDWYTQARLSRQKARDEATELLKDILADASANDQVKEEAVEKAAQMAQNVLEENNIESLIRAKGFGDCVVYIQNGECSVVISGSEEVENSTVIIKDIVSGQAAVEYGKIKIIENS